MRTAHVAERAGVNTQTLRYDERRGLLPDPGRTGAGYRVYGPDAVRTVRFVKRAQELGFTLTEVETLLDLAAGGPASYDATRHLATEKITELDRKIAHLQAMRASLDQLVATCARPRLDRDCPLLDCLDPARDRRRGSAMDEDARP